MVPHKQIRMCHYVLKVLYNQRLSHAKIVVENNFGILKKNLQGINNKVKLECLIPFRCGHLLLDVMQHDFEWQRF